MLTIRKQFADGTAIEKRSDDDSGLVETRTVWSDGMASLWKPDPDLSPALLAKYDLKDGSAVLEALRDRHGWTEIYDQNETRTRQEGSEDARAARRPASELRA